MKQEIPGTRWRKDGGERQAKKAKDLVGECSRSYDLRSRVSVHLMLCYSHHMVSNPVGKRSSDPPKRAECDALLDHTAKKPAKSVRKPGTRHARRPLFTAL